MTQELLMKRVSIFVCVLTLLSGFKSEPVQQPAKK
jgi:hypothetical protein